MPGIFVSASDTLVNKTKFSIFMEFSKKRQITRVRKDKSFNYKLS